MSALIAHAVNDVELDSIKMQEKNNVTDLPDDRVITLNSLFDGRLNCYQYKSGYRFSLDAVLVSHYSTPKSHDVILDLGTGCGVIGLILSYRHTVKRIKVTGLEKQYDLVEITRKNIILNRYNQTFEVVHGDVNNIRNIFQPESFSRVITNPPFYLKNTGRQSVNRESKTARHQDDTTLSSFINGAAYTLRNKGRIVLIYPANCLSELLNELHVNRIEPKRVQFIYSYPEHNPPAKLVLIEGVKNGGRGVKIEAPLYIYRRKGGAYSNEMAKMYEPNPEDHPT